MITIARPKLPLESQFHQKQWLLAGCDEVGRGCLAGPVVAGCCFYLPTGAVFDTTDFTFWRQAHVTDSKKLTKTQRQQIIRLMGQNPEELALDRVYQLHQHWFLALSACGPEIIDQINILQASLLAMKKAWVLIIQHLARSSRCVPIWPGELIIDGTSQFFLTGPESTQLETHLPQLAHFTFRPCPKADQQSLLVAMAAIFAKEYRDHYMGQMDEKYPGHQFRQNAGYPTAAHRQSIKEQGPCKLHRRSFRGVKEYCSVSKMLDNLGDLR